MRRLIEQLCGPACAGRRPGTPEGRAARAAVIAALREAGLDPFEQAVPACNGANVLATIPGDDDRYVLLAAHYDHLGRIGRDVFWGADDNAAAVAVLVEVARQLAGERSGRGVIIAAFDGEEPPAFLSGSREFVARNRAQIDFMVCMDLVGHRFGPAAVPDEVGDSLFALGAERSAGTLELVRSLKRSERGLVVRTADADIIPPLSDYEAFWRAGVPFLFLSAGRSRVYHTPDDTPDKLDFAKIDATARWLARFTREARVRPPAAFTDGHLDRPTLDEVGEVLGALLPFTKEAALGQARVTELRAACDRTGRLPEPRRDELRMLVGALEARLQ